MVADRHVLLLKGQRLAGCHAQLPLDQVGIGHKLRNRMLHLQARVHFHKVEIAVIRIQELDGTGSFVTDGTSQVARGLVHARANIVVSVEARRGALLDQLLVAALHRALALAERKHMALLIGHNLYLNVMRRRDELLHVALAVAKNGLALGTRLDERLCRIFHAPDLANAATATAGARLDEHGAANALGLGRCLLGAFEQIAARHDGHARRGSRSTCGVLVAHAVDHLGRRTNKRQAILVAVAHEARLLGEKAIAGMNCLSSRLYGTGEHSIVVEVALGKTRTADAIRLVGKLHVQRVRIGRGINGDGLDAHIAARADNTDRDFAAVGDEHFVEHEAFLNFRA